MKNNPGRPSVPAAVLALLALLTAISPALPAQDKPADLLLKVGKVIPVEGKEISRGEVLIKQGLIAAVGTGLKMPAGCKVISLPDAVVFPGLIDAGSYLGLYRHRDETTRPLLPDLRMEDAFNPFAADFKATLASGVTAIHLIPGDQDVVGGQTAVVEIRADGRPHFLARSAGLKLSLISSAWPKSRAPTSPQAAVALIKQVASENVVLAELCAGKRTAFISTGSRSQVDLACRMPALCGIKGVIIGGPDTRDFARSIREHLRGVILQPILPDAAPADRAVPALLEKAGVPVAFMTTAPVLPAASLRLQAQVACAGGMSRAAAHRALTLNPARFLGLEQKIGSLRQGKQGDVVVLSGDPTDPRARILMVIQNGRIAWQAEDQQ